MMQLAQHRMHAHDEAIACTLAVIARVHRKTRRKIRYAAYHLFVRPTAIEVISQFPIDLAQMTLGYRNQPVQTLSTQRPSHAVLHGVRPLCPVQ